MRTYDNEQASEDYEARRIVWFDRRTLTPLPPPLSEVEPPVDGFSGDRLWRARGWSTED